MTRLFIQFTATRDGQSGHTEHTRVIERKYPVEFDSDIIAIQGIAAELVGADHAILNNWRELKGQFRAAAPVPEPKAADQAPAREGWMWCLHKEHGQLIRSVMSVDNREDPPSPFGLAGIDHDVAFRVTRAPLFTGAEEVIHAGESK
jgi:hypothetical protein